MRKTQLRSGAIVTSMLALLVAPMLLMAVPVYGQSIAPRSGVVAAGDRVTVPIEITDDVMSVHGFQLDLKLLISSTSRMKYQRIKVARS